MSSSTTAPRRRREWIGVLGGSFDPVHLGHLRSAECVQQAFSLSRVLLVPCAIPPHKPDADLSPADHRLNMLRIATEGRSGLEVSTLEIDRGGVSYTIDTLRTLKKRELSSPLIPVFILGIDSLIEIPTWRDYRALLQEFDFIVLDRPGIDADDALDRLEGWIADRLVPIPSRPGAGASLLAARRRPGGRIYRLTMEPIPISASRIRARAGRGEPLDGLVPSAVARYIQEEGLYLQEGAR